MNSTLNKTANWFRCVGVLSETNLKKEDTDIKLRGEDGQPNGTTPGERIMGSVAVRTDNGIHTFNVYAQSLNSKGEPSKQWKMYSDMMEWNPEINGHSGEDATLVNIEGSVAINDYVNQQGEVSSSLRWRVGRGNTKASPDEPKGTTLNATVLITKIVPEMRNEEETGRLVVTAYGADNKGACFPITAIVSEDMADDFTECYEVGMTVPFEFQQTVKHIGGAKAGKRKFGHGADVAVNNGYDIPELLIVGGLDEIEEPEELTREDENGNEIPVKTEYIDPKVMKMAIKERAKMLEELKNNPKKSNKSAPKSGLREAKKNQEAKNKMKAGMKAKVEDFDDDDFTDEEDPF